jgi:LacI family transcriptional regulator
MRSRSTNVIGMIVPDVDDPFSIQLLRGVNRAIVELDYDLLIFTNGDILKNRSSFREQQYVSRLNSGITDGLLIVTPISESFTSVSPVVAIDPNIKNPAGPAVIASNYEGAAAATEYLIELGHRRIGFIEGRSDLQSAIRRKEGFEQTLRKAGIPSIPDLVAPGDFTLSTAIGHARRLLSLDPPPTAIFAANDQTAIGVLKAAEELGVRVPEDLSLVGFDNIRDAAYLNLTTVDQAIEQMGYVATTMLFDLIQGNKLEEDTRTIPTSLVIRGSCTPVT